MKRMFGLFVCSAVVAAAACKVGILANDIVTNSANGTLVMFLCPGGNQPI